MMIRVGLVVMTIQQIVLGVGLFLLWSVKDGTGIVVLPDATLQAASTVVGAGWVLGSLGMALGYIGLSKKQASGATGAAHRSDRA
ncbi:hypothetical protein ACFY05_42895 [Microtetraspora fusca]|uniref:Uncharacterized protein n=1 Tax=Microtetraspora fusca TaxID=1997 RepID=A0ABW6VJP1_MICFU